MEFDGRILRMLPQRSGISQRTGNDWIAQPFVFEYHETPTDIYADTVLLETYDSDLIAKMQEGMKCRCSFRHFVKPYNDRVFNEIKLRKLELIGDEKEPQEPPKEEAKADTPQDTPKPQETAEKADDLPF